MKLSLLIFSLFLLSLTVLHGNEIPVSSLATTQDEGVGKQDQKPSPECATHQRMCTISARHIQGAGVGYIHGYTTLENFLAPPRCLGDWNPYLDLRGHLFNNRKVAVNAGIGVRCIGAVAYGVNTYYDYRTTSRLHYHQIGIGLEAMGSFWSISLNGYLPIGRKESSFFDASITGTSGQPSFAFSKATRSLSPSLAAKL